MNFWTGEACYVRGVKNGCFGLRLSQMRHRYATLHAIASNTFLVLGPIDLTNGRAGMVAQLLSTLRGTSAETRQVYYYLKYYKNQDSVLSASSECR
jgi:hypothetical protein